MKKLIYLFVLLPMCFVGNAQNTQKSLTDMGDYIMILDSSSVDTTYAPLVISKDEIILIETIPNRKSGGVRIWIKPYSPGYQSYISLGYTEFNNYNNNEELRDALIDMWFSSPKNLFTYLLSGDASFTVTPSMNFKWVSVITNQDTTYILGEIVTKGSYTTDTTYLLEGRSVLFGGDGYGVVDTAKFWTITGEASIVGEYK